MNTQYLFDWKTFYEKKCCSKFPPQLCYPEFHALAMTAILNWYDFIATTDATTTSNDVRTLCFEYFKYLPNMIRLIFGPDSNIRVLPPEEIHELITNYVVELNISDTSIFFLETILRDQSSITNYRTILMNITLNYYHVDTLAQLTADLRLRGVCTEKSDHDITHLPPPSCHYLSYMSNATSIPLKGPQRWGPIFWIIFHTFAQNLNKENTNDVNMVNDYVAILPFLVPCGQCRSHYYNLVRPNSIPYLTDNDSLILLYQRIHALVTLDIKRIGSGSSRYTH